MREGNKAARTLLIESVHRAAQTRNCQFHGYHKDRTARRDDLKATVATGRKLLRIIGSMLSASEPYQDPKPIAKC